MFEEFMEEKQIKPAARDNMRKLPAGHKWTLLQTEYKEKKKDRENRAKTDPTFWVDFLVQGVQTQRLRAEDLRELGQVLGYQGKSWMLQFFDAGGLVALLEIVSTTPSPQIRSAVLSCLGALVDTPTGLKLLLTVPAAISSLALLLLRDADDAARMQVIQLLITIAWADPEVGYKSVLEAFSNPALGKMRFQILTQILLEGRASMNLKLEAVTLINALIDGQDHLDDRLKLRMVKKKKNP